VRLEDTAWANGVLEYGNQWPGPGGVNPNGLSVSIETEDLGNPHQEVTEAMYESVFQACLLALNTYPDIAYLMDHQVISPQSRPSCAGDRWRSGRIQQLANDLELSLILM
jgi:N-acetyl-anhydromuramyl-L-alanine amidase AmpD